MVSYISTRGGPTGKRYSFEEAVLAGWAGDGGMIVPLDYPSIDLNRARNFATDHIGGLPKFERVCEYVFSLFVSEEEVSTPDLRSICDNAFKGFFLEERAKLYNYPKNVWPSSKCKWVKCLELFHGPTCAFKDFGLQMLCSFLDYFLERSNRRATIVTGTSGDTGAAAIEALKNKRRIDLVLLYPADGRISKVQELQMRAPAGEADNIHLVGVEGSSDDLDIPLELVLKDKEFSSSHNLGSVNSVNIVRVLQHVVNYVFAQLCVSDDELAFFVPSGAGGHLCGGVIAQLSGLKMNKLVAACNSNDVLNHFIKTGVFRKSKNTTKTLSCAMDINMPYNIERLLYFLSRNPQKVTTWMAIIAAGEKIDIKRSDPDSFACLQHFSLAASRATDIDVRKEMQLVYDTCSYITDPHTSVALKSVRDYYNIESGVIVFGCASAAKFPSAVRLALSGKKSLTDEELIDLSATSRPLARKLTRLYKSKPPGPRTLFRSSDSKEKWAADLRCIIEDISLIRSKALSSHL